MPDIVKERPLLFNAPMVSAILDGSKTQTRRIAKGVVARHARTGEALSGLDSAGPRVSCPYGQPGERIWVRETSRAEELPSGTDGVRYFADLAFSEIEDTRSAADDWLKMYSYRGKRGATVPSIHMPRWASRIDLQIKSVRVERLQDISEVDAKSEGADCLIMDNCTQAERALLDMPLMENGNPYRNGFALLWEATYGPGSWAANPWVWAVEFERIKP